MGRLGGQSFQGCGPESLTCQFYSPPSYAVAVSPDGTVYWTATNGTNTSFLYKYTPGTSSPELLAANDSTDSAVEGPIGAANVTAEALAVDSIGRLLISDIREGQSGVWRLGSDDRVTRLGVNKCSDIGSGRYKGEGGPFSQACGSVTAMAIGRNGPEGLYLMDGHVGAHLRRVKLGLLRYPVGSSLVPSADGSEVFQFDPTGRQQATLDARTERQIRTFSYDSEGRIAAITEDKLGTTTFAYGSGTVVATGPDGQTTTLATNSAGWVTSVADAGGHSQHYAYSRGRRWLFLRSEVEDWLRRPDQVLRAAGAELVLALP
jgi:YD repeat-containing protein